MYIQPNCTLSVTVLYCISCTLQLGCKNYNLSTLSLETNVEAIDVSSDLAIFTRVLHLKLRMKSKSLLSST